MTIASARAHRAPRAAATSAPRSSTSSTAQADDRRPAHGRAARGRRASPSQTLARAPGRPHLPAACSPTDAAAVVADPDIDVVVEVIGGIEPARELILAALKARQAGRHRQQGAARQRRRRAVRRGRRGRRRPAVRGGGRRRHPAHPPAARVARAASDQPGAWASSTARPTSSSPDDRGGRRYADALAEAQRLGLRRARPDRRRRGLRRRRQGGDHRVDRVRRRRSSPATCTTRASAGITAADIAFADAARLRRQAARHRRAGSTTTVARSRVRVHPAMVPVDHPLACVRDSFNAVFVEGDAVGELMFYGRGAGGVPDGERGARRRHRRGDQPAARARTPASARSAGPHPSDRRDSAPSSTSTSTSPTGPACCARSPACSARTTCRSARWSRRASATRPA